ncbi:unnamed protein product, partial [Mesorhabditis spiculigera]
MPYNTTVNRFARTAMRNLEGPQARFIMYIGHSDAANYVADEGERLLLSTLLGATGAPQHIREHQNDFLGLEEGKYVAPTAHLAAVILISALTLALIIGLAIYFVAGRRRLTTARLHWGDPPEQTAEYIERQQNLTDAHKTIIEGNKLDYPGAVKQLRDIWLPNPMRDFEDIYEADCRVPPDTKYKDEATQMQQLEKILKPNPKRVLLRVKQQDGA